MLEDAEKGLGFISYYPLKQGLKLGVALGAFQPPAVFISYYPLKQGLKLLCYY